MTPIEEAQVRVAKAEDELAKLELTIDEDYSSMYGLDKACKDEKDPSARDRAKAYKTKHKEAKLEVRKAKSALERLRNEEGQKTKSEDATTVYSSDAQKNEALKKTALQVMEENAQKALASRSTSVVISDQGVSLDGGAPVPKEAVLAAIDVIQGRKRKVQMDLNGNKAKAVLSGRIKVPPERFELETPSWILRGPKEEVLDLVRTNQRPAVKTRVQKGLRAKKDAMINDGDFDEAVEQFTDEIMHGIIHRLPEDE